MLMKIAIGVTVLITVVLVFAMTKPDRIRIQRSIIIRASPTRILALINDFHNWQRWAPQDREDKSMTRSYAGPSQGFGAISEWQSRGSAGKGRMEIVASSPSEVKIKVDFERPFKAHNVNEFVLEPLGSGATAVAWTMQGTNPFIAKLMSIFVSMDRMMGSHFETGLANLKAAAETGTP